MVPSPSAWNRARSDHKRWEALVWSHLTMQWNKISMAMAMAMAMAMMMVNIDGDGDGDGDGNLPFSHRHSHSGCLEEMFV